MKNKSILIIAFKFPPMGGVGTRRWAKFAKYFAQQGFKVHVLTINYLKKDGVNWLNDVVDNENIIIHRTKSGYFNFLLSQSQNKWVNRFKYIIATLFKKTTHYLDVSQYWYRYMIPYASNLIREENIKNVIVTSAPHSVAYYATYLKIQSPLINLIQDFRDNWNDHDLYEYKKGCKHFWQKEKSVYMENFALQHSDYVINVTKDLSKRLRNRYKYLSASRFATIYNGYDMKDFENIKRFKDDNFSMVYAGSLGLKRDEALLLMLDALLDLNDKYLNDNFKLHVYSELSASSIPEKYKSIIGKNIFFHNKVSSNDILNIINKNNYCLTINSKPYPYAFGTKVFDYMALRKKIFLISNGGELYDILDSSGQFVSNYEIENMKKTLLGIKDDFLSQKINDTKYDKFNIENLTNEYLKLLV